MIRECGTAHADQMDTRLDLGAPCSEVLVEVATLKVLLVLTRSFQRDSSILARTPAVELCPQVVSPCTLH
jgi:hypothetical protein